MPIITYNTSLAAGASVNVMSPPNNPSIYETLFRPARVNFGLLAAAAGLTAFVSTGDTVLLESGAPVGVTGFAGRLPVFPDDFHLVDVVGPGERIKCLISNPTGGAIVPLVSIIITWL